MPNAHQMLVYISFPYPFQFISVIRKKKLVNDMSPLIYQEGNPIFPVSPHAQLSTLTKITPCFFISNHVASEFSIYLSCTISVFPKAESLKWSNVIWAWEIQDFSGGWSVEDFLLDMLSICWMVGCSINLKYGLENATVTYQYTVSQILQVKKAHGKINST